MRVSLQFGVQFALLVFKVSQVKCGHLGFSYVEDFVLPRCVVVDFFVV